jgi:CDP-diacylglycerol--glycerol-3-phosphate 3-phosphatidyltransferase
MIFLLGKFGMDKVSIGLNHPPTLGQVIATLVFVIAAITDGLDGYIARRNRIVTKLGKLLDPLADKLLITAALISLVDMHLLAAWVAIVIISREFAVTGIRLIAAVEGRLIAASTLGKVKTIVQILAIASSMLNNFPFAYLSEPLANLFAGIVTWIAVLITIWSGLDYFYKNRSIVFSV